MKPNSPCMKCEERGVGCHAACERYSYYRSELDKWRDIVNGAKREEARADGFRKATALRVKKYREKGGRL